MRQALIDSLNTAHAIPKGVGIKKWLACKSVH